jgi:hypothetical protein
MAAKLTRLTHKIVTRLHLVTAVPFAVLAPDGQSPVTSAWRVLGLGVNVTNKQS